MTRFIGKARIPILRSLLSAQGSNFSTTAFRRDKTNQVAVVLSGCGVYDGTEVHEAAATLAAITRRGMEPVVCAPDMGQAHVIDHSKGEEMSPSRNVMIESARIARGPVRPLSEISPDQQGAIIFPGGFGAAKNLSDFGFNGPEMKVRDDIADILKSFQNSGKPIGLCCISPIIAAKVFGELGVRVTLGKCGEEKMWPFGGALEVASGFGAEVIETEVNEICVDTKLKIVTNAAFMYNGKFHEIQDGVSKMIDAVLDMMEN